MDRDGEVWGTVACSGRRVLLRQLACYGHPGKWGRGDHRGQTVEVPEACASALDRTQAVARRRLCLRATFLNVSIIRNCVTSPFPKGLPAAARALILIGQIVFGFETQTVINETTVWPGVASPPCFSCWLRLAEVLLCVLTTVPGAGKLAAWSEKDGMFYLQLSPGSLPPLPSFPRGEYWVSDKGVLAKAMQGEQTMQGDNQGAWV